MRPLLLHASSPSATPGHRRVLHFDFASAGLDNGLEWYALAPKPAWRLAFIHGETTGGSKSIEVDYHDVPKRLTEILLALEKEKRSFLVLMDGKPYGRFVPHEETK